MTSDPEDDLSLESLFSPGDGQGRQILRPEVFTPFEYPGGHPRGAEPFAPEVFLEFMACLATVGRAHSDGPMYVANIFNVDEEDAHEFLTEADLRPHMPEFHDHDIEASSGNQILWALTEGLDGGEAFMEYLTVAKDEINVILDAIQNTPGLHYVEARRRLGRRRQIDITALDVAYSIFYAESL